ncbi:MAG: 4-hydroxythreonine-4-phosphate dehydrogenase PdxA [Gammaproteobacteria bacterium]|nr:4-hydroxythreonine-4-phosphate dehydrogenase PdxA [Gammaproteobacteria bacterium]
MAPTPSLETNLNSPVGVEQSLPPAIVFTPGEPAGIGPDLALWLARQTLPCRLAVAADPELLADRARSLGTSIHLRDWKNEPHRPGSLQILETASLDAPVTPGILTTANARYVLNTLDCAVDGCVAGDFDALVTGPVHKGIINAAGIPFTGHTEYLAQRLRVSQAVMLLVAGNLRVALATTHVPLAEVSARLAALDLESVIRILATDVEHKFGIAEPRIAVCGVNPHAGEGGHLGCEESRIIAPVVARLRAQGYSVHGPVPADTAFTPTALRDTDVVLAMYHDQGLPVLKHQGFGRAVNVTLGLPIVRTSVDHGTALALAGTGAARPDSLRAALTLAVELGIASRPAVPSSTTSHP